MTAPLSRQSTTLLLAVALATSPVQAEFLGLLNGRSANPGFLPDLSVEFGFVTGDVGTVDYQNIGIRINYRLSPDTVVMADIGLGEFGEADGTPMGLGVSYHLARQRISQAVDISARASYHTGEYKAGSVERDLSGLTLEALVSGREPMMANGLRWYGNFGYHRLTVDTGRSDSSNEIGIGAGLVLPTAQGEAYIGADLIDELTFGVGFRYFVQ